MVRVTAAYSPEARGRSERMFGTLQRRLPQELRLAGITDIAAANRFLAETFIPADNRRFRQAPAKAGTAFLPWAGGPQGGRGDTLQQTGDRHRAGIGRFLSRRMCGRR